MSEKDIKKLADLARQQMKEPRTKEQALAMLVDAGIMTKDGKYKRPYRSLALLVKK